MRLSDAIYCVEAIAYICGSADLSGKGEAKVAYMRKILWKEIEALMTAALEEEKTVQEPVQVTVQVMEKEPEQPAADTGDVLVRDRKECSKCRYFGRGNGGGEIVCQYILATGKPRGCKVRDCEHYKDGKRPKKKYTYKHTCEKCGKVFEDNHRITKLCDECKKGEEE